ncbi:MAG: hypothetical protein AB7N91_20355 [Candidatus Tectimicrobiota bacterium]
MILSLLLAGGLLGLMIALLKRYGRYYRRRRQQAREIDQLVKQFQALFCQIDQGKSPER